MRARARQLHPLDRYEREKVTYAYELVRTPRREPPTLVLLPAPLLSFSSCAFRFPSYTSLYTLGESRSGCTRVFPWLDTLKVY